MKLESLAFTQFPGQPAEWSVEKFTLGQINLIVGRNATGKTRLLNVINSLGILLGGNTKEMRFVSGKYDVLFKEGDNTWDYSFEYDNYEIVR